MPSKLTVNGDVIKETRKIIGYLVCWKHSTCADYNYKFYHETNALDGTPVVYDSCTASEAANNEALELSGYVQLVFDERRSNVS